jgi:hypothetical protein
MTDSRTWTRATMTAGAIGGGSWALVGAGDLCLEAGGCSRFPWLAVQIVAVVSLLVGVGGFHLRFRDRYGRLGAAGTALALVRLLETLVTAVTRWPAGSVEPAWSWGYGPLLVGWTVLGGALHRRSVASGPGAALLVLALPLGLGLAYASLLVLVPAFDLSIGENTLSAGPIVVYGVAWAVVSRSA